jgi:carbon monoxide dehydrogenase subunit G
MQMEFKNEFVVDAPLSEVWMTLLDLERVTPCMPGAELVERTGEDAYKVGIKVKVGPVKMEYRAHVEITSRDEARHQAVLFATAQEARGQGTADAQVEMTLVERDGATHTTVSTALQLSGLAAAMGRGVISEVSERLIERFAGNLAVMLEGPNGAASPIGVPERSPTDPWTQLAGGSTTAHPIPRAAKAPPGDAFAVGELVSGMIADRLRNPRTLVTATVVIGLTAGLIGFAVGRAG